MTILTYSGKGRTYYSDGDGSIYPTDAVVPIWPAREVPLDVYGEAQNELRRLREGAVGVIIFLDDNPPRIAQYRWGKVDVSLLSPSNRKD